MIDWTKAVRTASSYPESLGDVETITLGRVAYLRVPHSSKPGTSVLGFTPIGARLGKNDKLRLGREVLRVAGYVGWSDAEILSQLGGRTYTSTYAKLSRYPDPAPSHVALLDDVSYAHDSGGGSNPKDQTVLVG